MASAFNTIGFSVQMSNMCHLRNSLNQLATKISFTAVLLFVCVATAHAAEKQPPSSAGVKAPPAIAHTSSKVPVSSIEDTYQLDLRDETDRYRLSASDVIAVTFPRDPVLNQTVTVQPDGFVTLREAGDIRVAGLTIEEAAASIQSAYALPLRDPVIEIELKDFKRPFFIVSGEVRNPGKYELRGYTSVTEALAAAGGFSEFAKRSSVLLFRRTGAEWYEVKPLNLKNLLQGRDVNEDVQVRAGDMIVVSATAFSRLRRLFF